MSEPKVELLTLDEGVSNGFLSGGDPVRLNAYPPVCMGPKPQRNIAIALTGASTANTEVTLDLGAARQLRDWLTLALASVTFPDRIVDANGQEWARAPYYGFEPESPCMYRRPNGEEGLYDVHSYEWIVENIGLSEEEEKEEAYDVLHGLDADGSCEACDPAEPEATDKTLPILIRDGQGDMWVQTTPGSDAYRLVDTMGIIPDAGLEEIDATYGGHEVIA